MFRSMSTPTLATTVSAVAEMYPNISMSVILAGGIAGVDPRDEVWAQIDVEERALREERWMNSGFEPLDYIGDVLQGTYGIGTAVARGGMIAFDTIWEEGIAHPLRTGVVQYQDQELTLGSSWNEASASSGLRAAEQFFGDPMGNLATAAADTMNLFIPFADPFEATTQSRVNMGTGFFANSDLVEGNDDRVQRLVAQGINERDAMVAVTNDEYGSPSTFLFREGADAVQVTGRNGVSTGVSPGRLLAMTVTEPGTSEFNALSGTMDFGAQVFLDPSNILTAGASKMRLAARGLRLMDDSSGLINGIRRSVFNQDIDKALSSNIGQGALGYLSKTDDLSLIDSILSPATRNGQASNELLRQVQVTDNVDDMYKVIRSHTGTEISQKFWSTGILAGGRQGLRSRALNSVNRATGLIVAQKMPNYGGFSPKMRIKYMDGTIIHDAATGRITRGTNGRNLRAVSRLFSQMSGDRIDISNLSNGFTQVKRLARSLDLTPEDTQRALNRWVQLSDGSMGEAVEVVETMMAAYRKKLYLSGVSEEVANQMTAIYKTQDDMRKYFTDRAGDPQDPGVFTMMLGSGESVPVPMAHALSEMSGNFIPVPGDPRTIRRMTDFIKRSDGVLSAAGSAPASIFYKKDFSSKVGVRAADRFMGAWRPMVLLRPAWTLRVVGEEQVRMAAAGLHTFNHPARAFIAAVSDKNLQLGLTTRRKMMQNDVYGDALSIAQDYQTAMSRRAGTWFDSPGGYSGEKWMRYELDHADYDKWWFREINQLQTDHVSSEIARSMTDTNDARTLQDIKDAFFEGDLSDFRVKLAEGGGSARHKGLNTRQGADAYIDSLNARLHLKTGGRYEVLKDDGWWYDDAGVRLREAGESEAGLFKSAQELPGGAEAITTKGTRIKTRSLDEYREALARSGMTEDNIERKVRYLHAKGAVDDAAFSKLDADARTVLIKPDTLMETDILADARVIQFNIVQHGNQELLGAVGTGRLRGTNFDGNVSGSVEKAMVKHLKAMRNKPKGSIESRIPARLRPKGSTAPPQGDASIAARVDAGLARNQATEGAVIPRGGEMPTQPTVGGGADFVGGPPATLAPTEIKAAEEGFVNAPAFVKGIDDSDVGMLDGALDKGFDMMMGKQTNRYSRSPVFMRSYWNTISDLADQGLIDSATIQKLEKLLGRKSAKTLTNQSRRTALKHTELIDEHVASTERFLFDLEDELKGLPDDIVEDLKPAMDSLDELLSGNTYDVGRYDRIVGEITADLKRVEASLSESLISVSKSAKFDEAQRASRIKELARHRDEVQRRIKALDKIDGTEYADDLDSMYDAMGKMPDEYVDGLDPYPGLSSEAPSSLEEGIAEELERLRLAEGEADIVRRNVEQIPETSPETIAAAQAAVKQSELIDDFGPLPQPVKVANGQYTLETPFGQIEIVKDGNNWWVKSPASEFRTGLKGSKRYSSLKKAREDVKRVVTDEAIDARKVRKELSEQARSEARMPEGAEPFGDPTLGPVPDELTQARAQAGRTVRASRTGDEVKTAWARERGLEPGELPTRTKVAAGEYDYETAYGKSKIINETGKEWMVTLPGDMAADSGMARRQGFRTLKEATEHLRKANENATLGVANRIVREGRAYEESIGAAQAGRKMEPSDRMLTEEVVPGMAPPAARPYMEGQDDIVRQVFTDPEIQKLRQDLGATDTEIRTLAEARLGSADDAAAARADVRAGEMMAAALPDTPNQLMSIAEVDRIAKSAALTTTQELLYDLSKRSNFSDMMRNIFPFAEAWFEIVSTWSRLIQGNPAVLQRFQQAYNGLTEDVVLPESAFNIEGHDGHGFFYVDERTNKEMFAVPYLSEMLQGNEIAGGIIGGAMGAGMGGLFGGGYGKGAAMAIKGGIAGAAAGVAIANAGIVPEGESVDLAFGAQNVNMMTGSIMPGLGPLAAVPVSWVLNNRGSGADPIKDLFLPFGNENITSFGDFIDATLPSWATKFIQAVGLGDEDLQRVRANTTMEVAGMMVRRGEGSFSTPEEMKATIDSASRKSGWLYAIRGLAAFAGPTAPTFAYDTQDKNGAWFYTNTMVNQWSEIVKKHDGDQVSAFNEFTGLYGLMPQTFMTGKTKALTSAPLTQKAYDWKRDNQDIYDQFPGTAYLINPVDITTDEFSYDAYLNSLREGSRVAYTPKQWAEKSNQLAANVIMERFRQSADAFLAESPNKSYDKQNVDKQLYDLQTSLMTEYPGYARQIVGVPNPMSHEEKIDEINRWGPALKATPVGEAITSYMAARQNAEAIGRMAGNSADWWKTSTSPEAVRIREELVVIGNLIWKQEPGFSNAWNTMFATELRSALEEKN